MSTLITKNQISAIHALLKAHNLSDDKAQIILDISDGRTSSTRELTFDEAKRWISSMNKKANTYREKQDPRQKMVNSIIAMAREMGVIVRKNVVKPGGTIDQQSDYANFNSWMREKSYLKKNLNEYTYKELPKLVSQYSSIYKSWLNKFH